MAQTEFCICLTTNVNSGLMRCDGCSKLYHPRCLGKSDSEAIECEDFLCTSCMMKDDIFDHYNNPESPNKKRRTLTKPTKASKSSSIDIRNIDNNQARVFVSQSNNNNKNNNNLYGSHSYFSNKIDQNIFEMKENEARRTSKAKMKPISPQISMFTPNTNNNNNNNSNGLNFNWGTSSLDNAITLNFANNNNNNNNNNIVGVSGFSFDTNDNDKEETEEQVQWSDDEDDNARNLLETTNSIEFDFGNINNNNIDNNNDTLSFSFGNSNNNNNTNNNEKNSNNNNNNNSTNANSEIFSGIGRGFGGKGLGKGGAQRFRRRRFEWYEEIPKNKITKFTDILFKIDKDLKKCDYSQRQSLFNTIVKEIFSQIMQQSITVCDHKRKKSVDVTDFWYAISRKIISKNETVKIEDIPIKENLLIDFGYKERNYEPICFVGLKMRRWVGTIGQEYKNDLRYCGKQCHGGIKTFMKMIGLSIECGIYYVINQIVIKYNQLDIGNKCKNEKEKLEFVFDQLNEIIRNVDYWKAFHRPCLQLPTMINAQQKGYDVSGPKRYKKDLKAWEK